MTEEKRILLVRHGEIDLNDKPMDVGLPRCTLKGLVDTHNELQTNSPGIPGDVILAGTKMSRMRGRHFETILAVLKEAGSEVRRDPDIADGVPPKGRSDAEIVGSGDYNDHVDRTLEILNESRTRRLFIWGGGLLWMALAVRFKITVADNIKIGFAQTVEFISGDDWSVKWPPSPPSG